MRRMCTVIQNHAARWLVLCLRWTQVCLVLNVTVQMAVLINTSILDTTCLKMLHVLPWMVQCLEDETTCIVLSFDDITFLMEK